MILGLPGSVRADSLNVRLLRAAAAAVAESELEAGLRIYMQTDLESLGAFRPGEGYPEPVVQLRSAVDEADGLLIATPEYIGSLPGCLKNAIDWLSVPPDASPIRGKPVAVIGADRGEIGCDWAHADARKVLESAGARVIRDGLSLTRAAEAFGEGDVLRAGEIAEQLTAVIGELLEECCTP